MAQVQLYFSKSYHGYSSIGNINPSEDVARHVRDFAPALEILQYDATSPQIFYLISYIEEGLLLTLLRPLSGPLGAHCAATLFLPHGLQLSVENLTGMLDAVSRELDNPEGPGTDAMADLRKLLSQDYAIDDALPHFTPSSGHSYAYARLGGTFPTLEDYAGERFYQPDFADFAGVVLVDAVGKARGREHSRDLSGPLKKMLTMLPPKASHEGFVPNVGHAPFKRPIMVAKGSSIDIVWRRSGFESVVQHLTVDADGTTAPPCDTSKARKILTPASFYVSEQGSRNVIKEYTVTVNGTPIEGTTPFTFDKLRHAEVEVSAPGYFTYSGKLDLASTAQALVQLRKLHKSYRFDMPLVTPEPLEPLRLYVKTLKPLTSCPIEGYAISGGELTEGGAVNHLVYKGSAGKRHTRNLLLVAAGALVAGLLLGALIFGGDTAPETSAPAPTPAQMPETPVQPAPEPIAEPVVEPVAEPVTEPIAEAAPDFTAAAAYLDANKAWRRAEMEAQPALQGLYDDLNNYNFDRIKDYWAPKLADSKNFASVVRAVQGSATKRDPRTEKHNPTYNPADDESINWRSYTYWVDP